MQRRRLGLWRRGLGIYGFNLRVQTVNSCTTRICIKAAELTEQMAFADREICEEMKNTVLQEDDEPQVQCGVRQNVQDVYAADDQLMESLGYKRAEHVPQQSRANRVNRANRTRNSSTYCAPFNIEKTIDWRERAFVAAVYTLIDQHHYTLGYYTQPVDHIFHRQLCALAAEYAIAIPEYFTLELQMTNGGSIRLACCLDAQNSALEEQTADAMHQFNARQTWRRWSASWFPSRVVKQSTVPRIKQHSKN
jgi:hypothetical protein